MSRFHVTSKLLVHEEFHAFMHGEAIMPINVEISPSAVCYAGCPECLYAQKGYSREGFAVTGRFLDVLAEMEAAGVKAVTWSGGGEPTEHPDFDKFVNGCGKMKQGLFTNAMSAPGYNPEKLNWIRVTVVKNRCAPVENIKKLRACKVLGLCVNVREGDDDEVRRALSIADETGADYVQVRPALRANGEMMKISIPSGIIDPRVKVADYKFEDCSRPRGYVRCYGYHFVPFLWENGDLDVCGYMREHGGCTIGNVYERSFREIILGAPEHVATRPVCQVCCKNHEINKLINDMKTVEDADFV